MSRNWTMRIVGLLLVLRGLYVLGGMLKHSFRVTRDTLNMELLVRPLGDISWAGEWGGDRPNIRRDCVDFTRLRLKCNIDINSGEGHERSQVCKGIAMIIGRMRLALRLRRPLGRMRSRWWIRVISWVGMGGIVIWGVLRYYWERWDESLEGECDN